MFTSSLRIGPVCSLAILACLLIFIPYCPANGEGAEEQNILTIDHRPARATSAGAWTEVEAKLESEAEILAVRLYFKTMKSDWYVYLPMAGHKNKYSAKIPPARNATRGLDYFLLIVLADDKVLRTKNYRVLVQDNYEAKASATPLAVKTEQSEAPPVREDFGIPLQVNPSTEPLLANVARYQHKPIDVPGPATRKKGGPFTGGVGMAAISITAGSFGITYKTSGGN